MFAVAGKSSRQWIAIVTGPVVKIIFQVALTHDLIIVIYAKSYVILHIQTWQLKVFDWHIPSWPGRMPQLQNNRLMKQLLQIIFIQQQVTTSSSRLIMWSPKKTTVRTVLCCAMVQTVWHISQRTQTGQYRTKRCVYFRVHAITLTCFGEWWLWQYFFDSGRFIRACHLSAWNVSEAYGVKDWHFNIIIIEQYRWKAEVL